MEPGPSTSLLPKPAHTLCPPPSLSPVPARNVLQHLPGALPPSPSSRPARCPRPPEAEGRDSRPRPRKRAGRPAVLARTGQERQWRPQCPSRRAGTAPCSSPQQPPRLLRTHNKQCGARAGSANRLNRRLNRRPPGTARRAGAGPVAAYPRRRAPPASVPRSRSAAAATSSARVSGSSAQRRRLRRLLPWWRSRIRDRLRRQRRPRRQRTRDNAEHAHWPIRGAGPRLLGNGKPAPSPSARPLHARSAAPESSGQRPPPPAPTAHLGTRKGAQARGRRLHLRDRLRKLRSAHLAAPGSCGGRT